ncbi:MAG: TrkA family potassium uptake protein [Thermomicrobiales bacterium]|nr:TrkA family potassium uptake protein [Thermomicrobiales bacterium]
MNKPRVGLANRVAVIGLGRFGTSVARTLHDLGYEVTAIDSDQHRIEDASDFTSLAAQGDATDEDLLRSLDVGHSDVAIVSMSSNLEASILATLQLKRIGVPWVVAKARAELHGELLRRIGADRVILPERDAGVRLARSLAVRSINDYISLSPTSGVAKFIVPPHFTGKTIQDLLSACKAKLSVLLIKRGQTLIVSPSFVETIQPRDELVVVGPDIDIEAFIETTPGHTAGR